MKTAVSAINSSLSTMSWKDFKFQINQFIGYAASHPIVKIRYLPIQMHSWIHPDVSYLNEYEACSRNGDFSTFWKNRNFQSNQIILHQKPMHQLLSTEKSSTLPCPLFNKLELDQFLSTANIMCPFAMT